MVQLRRTAYSRRARIRFCVLKGPFDGHFEVSPKHGRSWILSGQAGFILLRGGGPGEPLQRLAVVSGHPFRRVLFQLFGLPLQLGEVVKGISSVQLAGMDQAHEQVTDFGAVQSLIEERVFAVQDRFLESSFDDIIFDWLLRLFGCQPYWCHLCNTRFNFIQVQPA